MSRQRRGSSELGLAFVVQLLSRVGVCYPRDCSMPGFPVFHHWPYSLKKKINFDCTGSSLLSKGFSLVTVCGLLTAVASLVVEHRL